MNLRVLCIFCATIVVPKDVFGFNLVKEILSSGDPVTKVSTPAEAANIFSPLLVWDTAGLIQRAGYQSEEHTVITQDGYNITIFRISGSPISAPIKGKPVILLQHGFLASSDSWVLIGPHHDLAFMLADRGFDVWLGNVRGNSYGRAHIALTPEDKNFWQFSFHEMATRDIPAIIDHALAVSNQNKLIYIGHSMGTTMAFVLLSEIPKYNNRIRLVVAFAPVAFWKDQKPPLLKDNFPNGFDVKFWQNYFEINEIWDFGRQSTRNVMNGRIWCGNVFTRNLCVEAYVRLAGKTTKHLNITLLPDLLSYMPAGASVNTFVHFGQNLASGKFRKFDYGPSDNFKIYQQETPPDYEVKKISARIVAIYGKKDSISTESNCIELQKQLPNVVELVPVSDDDFNHFDFLWGTEIRGLLYKRAMKFITKYAPKIVESNGFKP